jgi:hypothetical protein
LGCVAGWRGGAGGSVDVKLVARMVDFGPWWEIIDDVDDFYDLHDFLCSLFD